MSFDYSEYYRHSQVNGSAVLFFSFFIFIIFRGLVKSSGYSIFAFFTKEFWVAIKSCVKIIHIAAFLFALLMIISQSIYLCNGGLLLLTEQEADAIKITGEVEEIDDVWRDGYQYYVDEEGPYYGAKIEIDGTTYFMVHSGDLQVGDTVSVMVLPKSKMVLKIYRINSE